MSSEPVTPPPDSAPSAAASATSQRPAAAASVRLRSLRPGRLELVIGFIALLGLVTSGMLWQKLGAMQEQLARQTAASASEASYAKTAATRAEEKSMAIAAKQAVMEARLSEVSLQRSQLEELMQSLARSRDENLVVDIESSLRLALQQAQLTGSLEPLLAALKTADQRISRAAQPRLGLVQRAIARDTGRVKATALADMPALLARLDELVSLTDAMPVANQVATSRSGAPSGSKADETQSSWWQRLGQMVRNELGSLVRVRRIEDPEAALLTPEQSFFLHENLKLKLLNARLGLLSRQNDAARADLEAAAATINKYFDTTSRTTQTATKLLTQVQAQMGALEIPRIDETLTALSTAAAGR